MAKCSLYRVVIDGEIKKRQIILLSNNDETLEREIAAATNAKLRVEECQVCLAGNYLSNAVWRTIIFQNDVTLGEGQKNAEKINKNSQPKPKNPNKVNIYKTKHLEGDEEIF